MNDRRTLDLADPGAIMPEVDRLLRAGYRPVGNWSLGQTCNHLAGVICLSIEGFPRLAPWPIRATMGRVARRIVLQQGRMPSGLPLPERSRPQPGLDDRAEAEALRAAVGALGRHAGAMAVHPLLGALTAAQWGRFHAVHAAHHLACLLPTPPPPTDRATAPAA